MSRMRGKGVLLSESGETVGVCDVCHGRCYSPETLSVHIHGVNIDELLNAPLDQIGDLTDDKKMTRLSFVCGLLGIGYLTLSRKSKSLSTGELQRLRLAYSLTNKQESGQLYLLDEPSKGLHDKDAGKLAEAIHLLVDAGNTVLAVEHNAHLIACSDYLVELGGTGREGGHLLYSGVPSKLSGTPTADLIYHASPKHARPVGNAMSLPCRFCRNPSLGRHWRLPAGRRRNIFLLLSQIIFSFPKPVPCSRSRIFPTYSSLTSRNVSAMTFPCMRLWASGRASLPARAHLIQRKAGCSATSCTMKARRESAVDAAEMVWSHG